MSSSSAILADAPIRFFDLNEASGTTAADSSVSNVPGTLSASGVTYSATGLTLDGDTAVTFSGIGHLTIPASADLNFGTAPFTVEFWIKTTSGGGTGTFVAAGNAGTGSWWLGFVNGYVVVSLNGEVYTIVYPGAPADGVAHQIVLTRSGTSLPLYIDGSQVTSATISASLAVGNSATATGVAAFDDGSFPLNGTYDKVAIYKGTALSASRVRAHYNAALGRVGSPTPLMGGFGLGFGF